MRRAASDTRSSMVMLLLLLVVHTCAASLQQRNAVTTVTYEDVAAPVVHKCCGRDEIVVVNRCRSANLTGTAPWTPEFADGGEDGSPNTFSASSVSYK